MTPTNPSAAADQNRTEELFMAELRLCCKTCGPEIEDSLTPDPYERVAAPMAALAAVAAFVHPDMETTAWFVAASQAKQSMFERMLVPEKDTEVKSGQLVLAKSGMIKLGQAFALHFDSMKAREGVIDAMTTYDVIKRAGGESGSQALTTPSDFEAAELGQIMVDLKLRLELVKNHEKQLKSTVSDLRKSLPRFNSENDAAAHAEFRRKSSSYACNQLARQASESQLKSDMFVAPLREAILAALADGGSPESMEQAATAATRTLEAFTARHDATQTSTKDFYGGRGLWDAATLCAGAAGTLPALGRLAADLAEASGFPLANKNYEHSEALALALFWRDLPEQVGAMPEPCRLALAALGPLGRAARVPKTTQQAMTAQAAMEALERAGAPWAGAAEAALACRALEAARAALEGRGHDALADSDRCKALVLRASDALQNIYTSTPWRLFSERLPRAAPAGWGAMDLRWRLAPVASLTSKMIQVLPEMAAAIPGWSPQKNDALASALVRGQAEVASFVEAMELRESISKVQPRHERRSRSL